MPYFCYIHRETDAAPYFEVLPDMPRANAIRRAGALMAERPGAERAEVWDEERLLFTVSRRRAYTRISK